MPSYSFTEEAKEDLLRIASFGDEHFGFAQSDRYRDKLKGRFTEIAESPLLYPLVDHIRQGYRRSVCGVHSIYYKIEVSGILIVRVLNREDVGF